MDTYRWEGRVSAVKGFWGIVEQRQSKGHNLPFSFLPPSLRGYLLRNGMMSPSKNLAHVWKRLHLYRERGDGLFQKRSLSEHSSL
jgi:hypothetical protein